MKLVVIAVGRLKTGFAREGCDEYIKRLKRAFPTEEIEVRDVRRRKTGDVARWKAEEADSIRGALPRGARMVALDERGRSWTSREFATWLGKQRDQSVGTLAFVIGGPDGLDANLRASADLVWSLSPLTMPHELARLVLCEQLYRGASILAGSPYHRD